MKFRNLILILVFIKISGCVGYSSTGVLGTGVSVAMDPRTIGTQIDDSLMQKNLRAKLIVMDKGYLLNVKTKVLDGRIFITGKVNTVEEKLKITKLGWEIKGARSVKNDLKIKEELNFSFIFRSFLIDLAPFISQPNFVIFSFSSTVSTLPVINILPSKTLVFTFNK